MVVEAMIDGSEKVRKFVGGYIRRHMEIFKCCCHYALTIIVPLKHLEKQ